MFVREVVLDEGVEEFVVEGLVPGLRGERLSEVRVALMHDQLKADHGGVSLYGWGFASGVSSMARCALCH